MEDIRKAQAVLRAQPVAAIAQYTDLKPEALDALKQPDADWANNSYPLSQLVEMYNYLAWTNPAAPWWQPDAYPSVSVFAGTDDFHNNATIPDSDRESWNQEDLLDGVDYEYNLRIASDLLERYGLDDHPFWLDDTTIFAIYDNGFTLFTAADDPADAFAEVHHQSERRRD